MAEPAPKKKEKKDPRWMVSVLHGHYPELFTDPSLPSKEQKWKPLAIGIGYELEKSVNEWIGSGAVEMPQNWQRQTPHQTLAHAMYYYTHHHWYLRALTAKDSRRWNTQAGPLPLQLLCR